MDLEKAQQQSKVCLFKLGKYKGRDQFHLSRKPAIYRMNKSRAVKVSLLPP
jgi:hypothetical protein